jgi:hypothetical protein
MRLRLGLLQDPAMIEKQIAREAAEAQARKHKLEAPTVRTEAEMRAYEAETAEVKKKAREKTKPRIRPLSEAKAIDTGANFVSETFLFLVSVGLIGFEWARRERKENSRRVDVADRIEELEETERTSRRAMVDLEREILRLRALAGQKPTKTRILPKELWDLEQREENEEREKSQGWLSWIPRFGFKHPQQAPAPSPAPLLPSPNAFNSAESEPTPAVKPTASAKGEKASESSKSDLESRSALDSSRNSA